MATGPRLGRGISIGNVLDVASGTEPGFPLAERHFDEIARAGFETVRLPVRWSAHAPPAAPYPIAPGFFARVDWAVDRALARGLHVVLDVHHYHELYDAVTRESARFLALWRQIADRYADRPGRLCFELLNEPRDPMTAAQWNALLPEALAVVRESNPDRTVIVGPAQMNDVHALPTLALPDDDHLIVTFHYYHPFRFTHQGADWVAGADRWLGRTWAGAGADRDAVRTDFEQAAAWAADRDRPLFVGEFGTGERADLASRVRWTAFVRREAERLGMSWAYWDLTTEFGIFAPQDGTWHDPLRRALIQP